MPPPHSHILNIQPDQEFSPFFLDIGEVPEAAEDDPEEGDGDGRQEEGMCLSVWSRGEVREGIRGPQRCGRAGLKKAGKAAL